MIPNDFLILVFIFSFGIFVFVELVKYMRVIELFNNLRKVTFKSISTLRSSDMTDNQKEKEVFSLGIQGLVKSVQSLIYIVVIILLTGLVVWLIGLSFSRDVNDLLLAVKSISIQITILFIGVVYGFFRIRILNNEKIKKI